MSKPTHVNSLAEYLRYLLNDHTLPENWKTKVPFLVILKTERPEHPQNAHVRLRHIQINMS